MRYSTHAAFIPLAAALLGGCDPTFFADAEGRTAVVVHSLPEQLSGPYGSQLASVADGSRSFFYAGMPNIVAYQSYEGYVDDDAVLTGLEFECEDCKPADARSSLTALEAFGELELCSVRNISGVKDDDDAYVLSLNCASEDADTLVPDPGALTGESFAFAMAPLAHAKALLASEPLSEKLFAVTSAGDEASLIAEVAFDGFTPGEGFGEVLASLEGKGDTASTWVAAREGERIVVLEVTGDDNFTATPRGCVDAGQAVTSIALAFLSSGTDTPDLLAGGPAGVVAVSAAELEASDCAGGETEGGAVGCGAFSDEDEGIEGDCASDAPASVAFGDIDGDGALEALVGTPAASVGGKAEAGAAFVVRVTAGETLELKASEAEAAADPTPSKGAQLGFTVAPLRAFLAGGERDELLVGAPGDARVYTFLCTGLDDDAPGGDLDDRCQ